MILEITFSDSKTFDVTPLHYIVTFSGFILPADLTLVSRLVIFIKFCSRIADACLFFLPVYMCVHILCWCACFLSFIVASQYAGAGVSHLMQWLCCEWGSIPVRSRSSVLRHHSQTGGGYCLGTCGYFSSEKNAEKCSRPLSAVFCQGWQRTELNLHVHMF